MTGWPKRFRTRVRGRHEVNAVKAWLPLVLAGKLAETPAEPWTLAPEQDDGL